MNPSCRRWTFHPAGATTTQAKFDVLYGSVEDFLKPEFTSVLKAGDRKGERVPHRRR